MSPLRKSRVKQAMPNFLPTIRRTLVAPILPEPCSRILIPRDLAMSRPKGIEPSRNAMIGKSQMVIVSFDVDRCVVLEVAKVYVSRCGCQYVWYLCGGIVNFHK